MKKGFVLLMVLMVGLAGCAATLEHPVTHQRMTCQSGWWLGGGTGIVGMAMLGIAIVGNVFEAAEHQKCIDDLKQAGYEEVTPAPTPSETTVGDTERIPE